MSLIQTGRDDPSFFLTGMHHDAKKCSKFGSLELAILFAKLEIDEIRILPLFFSFAKSNKLI